MNHLAPKPKQNATSRRYFGLVVVVPLATALLVATPVVAATTDSCSAVVAEEQDSHHDHEQQQCCGGTVANDCDCDCDCSSSRKSHLDAPVLSQAPAAYDSHCPPHQPLRFFQDQDCVPCVAFTDHPAEPDWGCPMDRPLCVTTTSTTSSMQQRAQPGQGGNACAPYPCRNTNQGSSHLLLLVDEGCTQDNPMCVDALGNDPPPGGHGIQCVAAITTTTTSIQETLKQETAASRTQRWGRPAFGLLVDHSQKQTGAQTNAAFALVSLCMRCPLSGQGRSCEATKSCDSLGGVIDNDW
jgi:hypothetical protein